MTFTSFAQNFEDVILKRVFKDIEVGFYIDVGAHHPITGSVTKAFYDSGWRGINIEPVQYWYNSLCVDRPEDINLKIAVSNYNGIIDFYEIPDTGLSTASYQNAEKSKNLGYCYTTTSVNAKTLETICQECNINEVQFLKIDVEGCEADVLKGANFITFRPWVVLIEATAPMSQIENSHEWDHILLSNDYAYVYFDGLNRFYLAQEHSGRKQAFSLPPNIFDDFIQFEHIEALVRVQQLEEELKNQKDYFKREIKEITTQKKQP